MPSPTDRMNILFLMTDQHRVDTLGCYGGSPTHTPVLDALAARGTVFDAAYTPSAICTPARASLLTGTFPFEHGMVGNFEWSAGAREDLDPTTPTFASELREAGYAVAHVGKWHVGKENGPEAFGLDGDHIRGALNDYAYPGYLDWLARHGHRSPTLRGPIHSRLPDGSKGHLIAGKLDQPTEATFEAYLADQAIEKIETYAAGALDGSRPLHLSCHFFGPHLPYLLPEEWFDLHDPAEITLPASMAETFAGKPLVQRRYSGYWGADSFDADTWRLLHAVYRGYVALIDAQIGRILDALADSGLTESTMVCFTADHGEFTGAHRLNDKGPAMYEDIYRIPAILSAPGRAAGRSEDFVSLVDFHATILDAAGLDTSGSRGESLLGDAWQGREYVLAEFHGHHFAYAQRMIRDRRFKLVINPEGIDEFYDLRVDSDELHNLIDVPRYGPDERRLRLALYRELTRRGDRFAQWLAMSGGIAEADRIRPETAVENVLG